MYAEYYIVGCATAKHFFNKEHILILIRYHLHSMTQCPSEIRMQTAITRRIIKKKKSCNGV
jgi:hypothetical protein